MPRLWRTPFEAQHSSSADTVPVFRGPNRVHFVFVAGARKDLAPFRESLQPYGESSWEWRPYNEPIGLIAQAAASALNLLYTEMPADDNFTRRLRSAQVHRESVLILLDLWALNIPSYAESMLTYDRLAIRNSGLILPWNDDDAETISRRQELDKLLLNSLAYKLQAESPAHDWTSVHSSSDLWQSMEKILTLLRLRTIEDAAVRLSIESPELALRVREQGLSIDSLPSILRPGESEK